MNANATIIAHHKHMGALQDARHARKVAVKHAHPAAKRG